MGKAGLNPKPVQVHVASPALCVNLCSLQCLDHLQPLFPEHATLLVKILTPACVPARPSSIGNTLCAQCGSSAMIMWCACRSWNLSNALSIWLKTRSSMTFLPWSGGARCQKPLPYVILMDALPMRLVSGTHHPVRFLCHGQVVHAARKSCPV